MPEKAQGFIPEQHSTISWRERLAAPTARNWKAYESILGIAPEALTDKIVLNFGSGGSNIDSDLKIKGVNCNVVNLDLRFDPPGMPNNLFDFYVAFKNELSLRLLKPNSVEREQLVSKKRRALNTEGRIIVQGNGRALPFPDKAFDYILALESINYLPGNAQRIVFEELMRVGNILHLSPVSQNAYEILSETAARCGYEIIAREPIPPLNSNVSFRFSRLEDYDNFQALDEKYSKIQMLASKLEGDTVVLKKWA